MKSRYCLLLVAFALYSLPQAGQASLFGPWHRYRSESLGFQLPVVADWQVTELKNCIVFALQLNPEPYVRLAVGRIPADTETFEQSVRTQLARNKQSSLSLTPCEFEGMPAFRVEGQTPNGRILDYYVDRGAYHYWISFIADRPDLWDAYAKSFDIILKDFHFL